MLGIEEVIAKISVLEDKLAAFERKGETASSAALKIVGTGKDDADVAFPESSDEIKVVGSTRTPEDETELKAAGPAKADLLPIAKEGAVSGVWRNKYEAGYAGSLPAPQPVPPVSESLCSEISKGEIHTKAPQYVVIRSPGQPAE